MYEYFISYRYYLKKEGQGYGNINVCLKNKINKAQDVQLLRDIIQKEYPEYEIVIILFFKEFLIKNELPKGA